MFYARLHSGVGAFQPFATVIGHRHNGSAGVHTFIRLELVGTNQLSLFLPTLARLGKKPANNWCVLQLGGHMSNPLGCPSWGTCSYLLTAAPKKGRGVAESRGRGTGGHHHTVSLTTRIMNNTMPLSHRRAKHSAHALLAWLR